MPRRRVFITGLGMVSPLGENPREVFDRVYSAQSAVRMVRSGTADFGSDVLLARAAFDPGDRIPKVARIFMARAAQMAVVASLGALESSRLLDDPRLAGAGVYMGCGLGGAEILEQSYRIFFADRSRRAKPTTVPLIMASGPASHVSMRFGLRGPTHTYSIACASSAVSIGEAFRAIRDGYLELALAGGAEAMLNDGSVAAWERLGVMAREHAEGAAASCRPFDAERTGLVLGEGSVMLTVESEGSMRER